MTNANDSFIDEVTDALRRDRLASWFRRWGWMVLLAVVLVVGAAAWIEWRQSQARAAAELRGEAILSALELPEGTDRLSALAELPREGADGAVAALLLAAEQEAAGDAGAAVATYLGVADDAAVAPLYRDLARLKGLMIASADDQDAEADIAGLQELAAPGAPFRLLALEAVAAAHLRAGNRDGAIAALTEVRDDAGVGPAQRGRAESVLTALGAPDAEAGAPALTEAPAE